jgi:hypothetical protein
LSGFIFIIDVMYSGLTTRVKWKGELSNTYPVLQGVRQGGILSTHLYKIFVQDLLLELLKGVSNSQVFWS